MVKEDILAMDLEGASPRQSRNTSSYAQHFWQKDTSQGRINTLDRTRYDNVVKIKITVWCIRSVKSGMLSNCEILQLIYALNGDGRGRKGPKSLRKRARKMQRIIKTGKCKKG